MLLEKWYIRRILNHYKKIPKKKNNSHNLRRLLVLNLIIAVILVIKYHVEGFLGALFLIIMQYFVLEIIDIGLQYETIYSKGWWAKEDYPFNYWFSIIMLVALYFGSTVFSLLLLVIE